MTCTHRHVFRNVACFRNYTRYPLKADDLLCSILQVLNLPALTAKEIKLFSRTAKDMKMLIVSIILLLLQETSGSTTQKRTNMYRFLRLKVKTVIRFGEATIIHFIT